MIYFIQSHNRYLKIGTTINVESRIKGLQTGSPIKLKVVGILDGSYATEAGLHDMFNHLHHNGEWFRYTDELKWFIHALRDNPEINNIKTLYMESQRKRLKAKAKRLGKNSNLSKRINGV